MFRIPEPATSLFLYSNLQHLKHCLIDPIESKIYIRQVCAHGLQIVLNLNLALFMPHSLQGCVNSVSGGEEVVDIARLCIWALFMVVMVGFMGH